MATNLRGWKRSRQESVFAVWVLLVCFCVEVDKAKHLPLSQNAIMWQAALMKGFNCLGATWV